MNNKMRTCKACGHEIAKNAKTCPQCGAKNPKPIFTKWWFWVVVIIFIGIVASAGGGTNSSGSSSTNNNQNNATIGSTTSVFDGNCGITATAEIGNNIINLRELTVTIKNTSEKEISAIKFYAVPYDVYGEEIKNWTTQKELYTDESIPVNSTKTVSYQLIEQSVKTVKLYVYSVYFSDGTEWGDKDATETKILKEAPTIEVAVKS